MLHLLGSRVYHTIYYLRYAKKMSLGYGYLGYVWLKAACGLPSPCSHWHCVKSVLVTLSRS